jgi:hypothetical protein
MVHRVHKLVRERGVETSASIEDYRRSEGIDQHWDVAFILSHKAISVVGKRRRPERSSRVPGAVVEVNHAVAETAFVQQFELQADVVGHGLLAASHHHRCDD